MTPTSSEDKGMLVPSGKVASMGAVPIELSTAEAEDEGVNDIGEAPNRTEPVSDLVFADAATVIRVTSCPVTGPNLLD